MKNFGLDLEVLVFDCERRSVDSVDGNLVVLVFVVWVGNTVISIWTGLLYTRVGLVVVVVIVPVVVLVGAKEMERGGAISYFVVGIKRRNLY